jgi:hypothetical protein
VVGELVKSITVLNLTKLIEKRLLFQKLKVNSEFECKKLKVGDQVKVKRQLFFISHLTI